MCANSNAICRGRQTWSFYFWAFLSDNTPIMTDLLQWSHYLYGSLHCGKYHPITITKSCNPRMREQGLKRCLFLTISLTRKYLWLAIYLLLIESIRKINNGRTYKTDVGDVCLWQLTRLRCSDPHAAIVMWASAAGRGRPFPRTPGNHATLRLSTRGPIVRQRRYRRHLSTTMPSGDGRGKHSPRDDRFAVCRPTDIVIVVTWTCRESRALPSQEHHPIQRRCTKCIIHDFIESRIWLFADRAFPVWLSESSRNVQCGRRCPLDNYMQLQTSQDSWPLKPSYISLSECQNTDTPSVYMLYI